MIAASGATRPSHDQTEEDMQITPFLKRVLLLDAASCLGMAAVLIAGDEALSRLFGVSELLLSGAAYMLIPVGLFIAWLGARSAAHAAVIGLVIVGNVIWTLESMLVAFTTAGITGLGSLFVAGQGAAVLTLAILEFVGLQRSRRPAAA
jgi:hypothetical protein